MNPYADVIIALAALVALCIVGLNADTIKTRFYRFKRTGSIL